MAETNLSCPFEALPQPLMDQVIGLFPRPEQFLCKLAQVSRGWSQFAYSDNNWTTAYRRRFRQLPPFPSHVMGQFMGMVTSTQNMQPDDANAILLGILEPGGAYITSSDNDKVEIGHLAPNMDGLVRTCIAAGANLEDPTIIWYATCSDATESITRLVYRALLESGVDITKIVIKGHICPETCPGESLLHQAVVAANNPAPVEILLERGADLVAFVESYRDCQSSGVEESIEFELPINKYKVRLWVAFQRAGVDLKPYLSDTLLHGHLGLQDTIVGYWPFPSAEEASAMLNRKKSKELSNVETFIDLDVGDLNARDDRGDGLLHIALENWIRAEANLNAVTRDPAAWSHHAANAHPTLQWRAHVWKWKEMIQLLIARGVDPSLTDAAGRTARQLAEASPLLPRCNIEEAFGAPAGRVIELPDSDRPLKRAKSDPDAQG
jgi:ankyrin repeat protein